jgi:DNA-binding response OmpR family regulator
VAQSGDWAVICQYSCQIDAREKFMASSEKNFYEFGPYRIDPEERLLFRGEEPVPLPPKAFDTLL